MTAWFPKRRRHELNPAPAGMFWFVAREPLAQTVSLQLWRDGCKPDRYGRDEQHGRKTKLFPNGYPHHPLGVAYIDNPARPNFARASREVLLEYAQRQTNEAAIKSIEGVRA